MKHPWLVVGVVLVSLAAWQAGLAWVIVALAAVAVGGMLALTIGLCVVAADADDDMARTIDGELHESEDVL